MAMVWDGGKDHMCWVHVAWNLIASRLARSSNFHGDRSREARDKVIWDEGSSRRVASAETAAHREAHRFSPLFECSIVRSICLARREITVSRPGLCVRETARWLVRQPLLQCFEKQNSIPLRSNEQSPPMLDSVRISVFRTTVVVVGK